MDAEVFKKVAQEFKECAAKRFRKLHESDETSARSERTSLRSPSSTQARWNDENGHVGHPFFQLKIFDCSNRPATRFILERNI